MLIALYEISTKYIQAVMKKGLKSSFLSEFFKPFVPLAAKNTAQSAIKFAVSVK
jgi:hypothetical protein